MSKGQRLIEELTFQLEQSPKTVRRVFHGRGKAFEALEHINIEWYPPYLIVQNFSTALDDETNKALQEVFEKHEQIEAVLVQAREWPDFVTRPLCQNKDVSLPILDWMPLADDIDVEVSLGKNRNTGVFLDMRAGWNWVRANSKDKRVLNLFSYTGVFSLFALRGGATKVDNMDMAANVLKISQRNHEHNNLHEGGAGFYKRDALKSDRWFETREPYDLIILDPPPYQKKAFRGWNDYKKLLVSTRACLAEGGQLFVCLNNPQATIEEFQQDLENLFPERSALELVERAPEIRELDNNRGLKTIVLTF